MTCVLRTARISNVEIVVFVVNKEIGSWWKLIIKSALYSQGRRLFQYLQADLGCLLTPENNNKVSASLF